MGNCLVMQEKDIKVMKTDGKVLQYKEPTKVHHVLSEFADHAIFDTLPIVQHLRPDTKMVGGHLYYLRPLLVPPPGEEKKRNRFANQERESSEGSGVMRIKVVISKQKLEMMLRNGGVSVDDMVSQHEKKETMNQNSKFNDEDGNKRSKGWKPALESIPEVY